MSKNMDNFTPEQMSLEQRRRYLSFLLRGQGFSRRSFLKRAVGGAAAFALGGAIMPLLSGCGSGTEDPDEIGGGSAIPATTRILVTTFLNETVEAYNAKDRFRLGTFVPSQGSGITTAGVINGPGNNIFLVSPGSDRFFLLDKETGEVKKTVKGLTTPHTGTIGPDGNFYVVNAPSLNGNVGLGPDTIEVYDGNTADHLGRFCEVRAPFSIIFDKEGKCYVSSTVSYNAVPLDSDYVSRFSATGEFEGYIVEKLRVPFNMALHPDGDLLIVEHFNNRVNRFKRNNGEIVDSFVNVPFPIGVAYGPDGHFYCSSFTDTQGFNLVFGGQVTAALGAGRVLKFDGKSGKPYGEYLTQLPFGGFIAFVA